METNFQEIDFYRGRYFKVESFSDGVLIAIDENVKSFEDVDSSMFIESIGDYIPDSFEIVENGLLVRLSAPGYLDATDWFECDSEFHGYDLMQEEFYYEIRKIPNDNWQEIIASMIRFEVFDVEYEGGELLKFRPGQIYSTANDETLSPIDFMRVLFLENYFEKWRFDLKCKKKYEAYCKWMEIQKLEVIGSNLSDSIDDYCPDTSDEIADDFNSIHSKIMDLIVDMKIKYRSLTK